ncbi:MAG: hypothetical protein ABIZ34_06430 [Candidatus Limnocylindrales bacterium]
MGSTFCPRCETELLGTPGVCPACGYDESIDGAPATPADPRPYTERYRTSTTVVAQPAARLATFPRTRLMIVAALLAVAALYASLMLVTDVDAHAGASGPAATRQAPDH